MQKVLFILGELSDDDIDWMISTGSREEIPAGTILIQQGKPINALYLILDGTLSVSVANKEQKQIARLSTGEVVGEMSFVDSRPPSATVKAIANSVLLAVSRAELTKKLQYDIGFSARFYRALAVLLSNRLRGTVNQMGYGIQIEESTDELDTDALDNLTLAQARFDWLLRRLRGR